RACKQCRHRNTVNVIADEYAAQFFENQDQTVRKQHLLEMVALVQMREQRPLEEDAKQNREDDAEYDRYYQTSGERRQRERHVRTDHVEAAVRKIDDPHDAEDQREPACNEEQQEP